MAVKRTEYVLDFDEYFTKKAELENAMEAEITSLYKEQQVVLDEYNKEAAKMNAVIKEFRDNWDGRLESYKKQKNTIARKYRKMRKELENSETIGVTPVTDENKTPTPPGLDIRLVMRREEENVL